MFDSFSICSHNLHSRSHNTSIENAYKTPSSIPVSPYGFALEPVFAEAWAGECGSEPSVKTMFSAFCVEKKITVNHEEMRMAASLFQFLGSNMGISILKDALKCKGLHIYPIGSTLHFYKIQAWRDIVAMGRMCVMQHSEAKLSLSDLQNYAINHIAGLSPLPLECIPKSPNKIFCRVLDSCPEEWCSFDNLMRCFDNHNQQFILDSLDVQDLFSTLTHHRIHPSERQIGVVFWEFISTTAGKIGVLRALQKKSLRVWSTTIQQSYVQAIESACRQWAYHTLMRQCEHHLSGEPDADKAVLRKLLCCLGEMNGDELFHLNESVRPQQDRRRQSRS